MAKRYKLKKLNILGNKLFLICPFSQMETFLRNHYGGEIYFATAMGSLFKFDDKDYFNYFKHFIQRSNITEINLVVDTSCRFLNNVLTQEQDYNTNTEKELLSVFLKNYEDIVEHTAINKKQQFLAELIIKYQTDKLLNISFFESLIRQNLITLRGLITTISKNEKFEVKNVNKKTQHH